MSATVVIALAIFLYLLVSILLTWKRHKLLWNNIHSTSLQSYTLQNLPALQSGDLILEIGQNMFTQHVKLIVEGPLSLFYTAEATWFGPKFKPLHFKLKPKTTFLIVQLITDFDRSVLFTKAQEIAKKTSYDWLHSAYAFLSESLDILPIPTQSPAVLPGQSLHTCTSYVFDVFLSANFFHTGPSQQECVPAKIIHADTELQRYCVSGVSFAKAFKLY